MGRHLNQYFINQALKRGKGVAQFLGWFQHEGEKTVRYLLIYPREEGFLLWLQEVAIYDENLGVSFDISDFPSIHEDDESLQHTFPSLDETLHFASTQYEASLDRWVNESMIADEYADAYKSKQSQ